MRLSLLLPLLTLPLLAACDTAFDAQCAGYDALDDQVACLDTAFLALSEELPESDEGEERVAEEDRREAEAGECDRSRRSADRDELSGIHVRVRGDVERERDADVRGERIRDGLTEGRDFVDGRLGLRDRDREGDRDDGDSSEHHRE